MHIAIVTARTAVGTDEDEPLLLAALSEAGAVVEVVAWDDPIADWSAFDLAVVRSTWDYTLRRDAFLAWATVTAGRTRLCSNPDVLAWNTDKTYLRDLAAAGVPVVPTTFLTPNDEVRLLAGDGGFVVKPSVSAGSRDTARYTASEAVAARDHAQQLLEAGRTVLVQPYQDSVDARGETALVFVNGRFSQPPPRPLCSQWDGPRQRRSCSRPRGRPRRSPPPRNGTWPRPSWLPRPSQGGDPGSPEPPRSLPIRT